MPPASLSVGDVTVSEAAGVATFAVTLSPAIGQAVTGISTLAIGSILTFLAIVIGAAGTMKYQYWRMEQEG